jgi:hypothetical protein
LGFDFDDDKVAEYAYRDDVGRPTTPWTSIES